MQMKSVTVVLIHFRRKSFDYSASECGYFQHVGSLNRSTRSNKYGSVLWTPRPGSQFDWLVSKSNGVTFSGCGV